MISESCVKRFWAKVLVLGDDRCWVWQACSLLGYGIHSDMRCGKRVSIKAHRASWIIHNGAIPEGLFVLHKCNNKLCCNPNHLYLGDRKDNARDAVRDGCYHSPLQALAADRKARIGEDVIREILTSKESNTVLAKRLGIRRYYIKYIREGKVRKNLVNRIRKGIVLEATEPCEVVYGPSPYSYVPRTNKTLEEKMTKLILEKDVEKKVCDWAQKNGLISIKLSGPQGRGKPDRMFLNSKGQIMFIEFKKPGGQPTKLQEMWLETLEERGFTVMLCDNPDAGILALREKLL